MASRVALLLAVLRVDDAIEEALLAVLGPGAIAAAFAVEKKIDQRRDQVRAALERDLEAARYAADRAFRQYDATDPANRLVASELEARWNKALCARSRGRRQTGGPCCNQGRAGRRSGGARDACCRPQNCMAGFFD